MQLWFLEIVKDNDLFMLEVLSSNANDPSGIYDAFSDDGHYENKFIPGMIGDGMIGSWYAKLTDGVIKGNVWAPIVDGLVKVAVEGSTATITYSAIDDAGYKVEGTVSGAYTEVEAVE
jgi:hypothetical protein